MGKERKRVGWGGRGICHLHNPGAWHPCWPPPLWRTGNRPGRCRCPRCWRAGWQPPSSQPVPGCLPSCGTGRWRWHPRRTWRGMSVSMLCSSEDVICENNWQHRLILQNKELAPGTGQQKIWGVLKSLKALQTPRQRIERAGVWLRTCT